MRAYDWQVDPAGELHIAARYPIRTRNIRAAQELEPAIADARGTEGPEQACRGRITLGNAMMKAGEIVVATITVVLTLAVLYVLIGTLGCSMPANMVSEWLGHATNCPIELPGSNQPSSLQPRARE